MSLEYNNIINKKTQVLYDNILKKKHYKAILDFTYHFEGKEGLTQQYYRWGLVQNHDGIKSTSFINDIKRHYAKRILGIKIIKDGSFEKIENLFQYSNPIFKSRSALSNNIIKLSKEPYNLLEKNESEKHSRYKLSEVGLYLIRLNHLIDFIKAVHQDNLKDLEKYILKFIFSPYLEYGAKLENEVM